MSNFAQILKGGKGSGRHKLSADAAAVVDKVQAGTHRLVQAKGSSKYTIERKHPTTGEWLVGTKVHAATAKGAIPHLRNESGTHLDTWHSHE